MKIIITIVAFIIGILIGYFGVSLIKPAELGKAKPPVATSTPCFRLPNFKVATGTKATTTPFNLKDLQLRIKNLKINK